MYSRGRFSLSRVSVKEKSNVNFRSAASTESIKNSMILHLIACVLDRQGNVYDNDCDASAGDLQLVVFSICALSFPSPHWSVCSVKHLKAAQLRLRT